MLTIAPPVVASLARGVQPYVLLVDDHEPSLIRLHSLVSTAGHCCRMANSAPGALRECDRALPRLIVTDLAMPNLDGQGLALWLRARCPSVPLVLLTGETLDKRTLSVLQTTFTAVMPKPVDIHGLLSLIERLMPPAISLDPP